MDYDGIVYDLFIMWRQAHTNAGTRSFRDQVAFSAFMNECRCFYHDLFSRGLTQKVVFEFF